MKTRMLNKLVQKLTNYITLLKHATRTAKPKLTDAQLQAEIDKEMQYREMIYNDGYNRPQYARNTFVSYRTLGNKRKIHNKKYWRK